MLGGKKRRRRKAQGVWWLCKACLGDGLGLVKACDGLKVYGVDPTQLVLGSP